MEKKVKRLEMDFSVYDGFCARRSCYTFPKWFSCSALTSLELGFVKVTSEILEGFLCTCLVALEFLSVKYSRALEELRVVGPLLKLKSLSVYYCYGMKNLEISAPNLVFLCYVGPKLNMQLKSTPKLAQVYLGGKYVDNMSHFVSNLSGYLSQIEELTLYPCAFIENIIIPTEDFVFPRLKKLDVLVDVHPDDNAYFFASLMKACPFLLHFVLQLTVRNKLLIRKRRMEPTPCPHYHLKNVEIVGFRTKPIHKEVAVFIIENTFALEKITADPCKPYHKGTPWDKKETPGKIRARIEAEKLRALLKPGTILEIL